MLAPHSIRNIFIIISFFWQRSFGKYFADNDGNIIDENHTSSQTPKTFTPAQSINSIDIISEEIVNDTIIGE